MKYSLTLNINETQESLTFSGEFTDKEHELLLDFLRYTEDLSKTPFITKRNYGGVTFKGDAEGNFETIIRSPDWNDASLFIYKLRPFVLQKEPTYFHRIRKVISSKFTHEYFQTYLNSLKQKFDLRHNTSGIQIRSNQELLNSDQMLNRYLNSHEYHKDKDGQKLLEELHQMIPLDASRIIFLGLLIQKTQAIFSIADLIDVISGKQKEIKIQTGPKDRKQ